jgi:hypothetical protein
LLSPTPDRRAGQRCNLRRPEDLVVAVLAEDNSALLVPVEGNSVRSIDVGLPHAGASLHAVRVKSRMPRVIAEQFHTTLDRGP